MSMATHHWHGHTPLCGCYPLSMASVLGHCYQAWVLSDEHGHCPLAQLLSLSVAIVSEYGCCPYHSCHPMLGTVTENTWEFYVCVVWQGLHMQMVTVLFLGAKF